MSAPDTPSPVEPGNHRCGRRRRLGIAASVVAAATLIGVAALAFAHGSERRHGGPMDGVAMAGHFEDHVMHVFSEVDATDEQKSRIQSIVQAATTDIRALHDQHSGAREELKQILSAPTIDRARLESLRSGHILLADQASQRLVTAIADAAEVLTPEQRAELGRKMAERHERRHGDDD
jgi:periplasmic protein CpxP/Spy